jgi:AraC family transcriptional regulator, transcriptional activator FtrA
VKVHDVVLAITDGIPLFEVAAACEVFGSWRPGLPDPWYNFKVCGDYNARVGGWFRAESVHGFSEMLTADTVIIPACGAAPDKPHTALVNAVRAAYENGARLVSICTGAFVLAAAGALDGRRATTHWKYANMLAATYPRVHVDPNVLYIDEETVLTSAGKSAGLDLCLHIVRVDHGAAVANNLARRLVTPPHRDGGQAQFIPAPVGEEKDNIASTLLPWVTSRICNPLTVTDLARQANMSTRNLARHFRANVGVTPLQWLVSQRVFRAQELLEMTDHGIEQIADETGMGSGATLRRHFNRIVGVPPDAYRRTFNARTPSAESAGATKKAAAPAGAGTASAVWPELSRL